MIKIDFAIRFKKTDADGFESTGGGYIAQPYWVELGKMIDITKQSGMNRARSEGNRRKALEEWLKANNMTLEEFNILNAKSKEAFPKNDKAEIIIPADVFLAFLVHVTDEQRSASRACPPDMIRSAIKCTHLKTGKTEVDGLYERFAVVTGGAGNKLSNQRGLRSSAYITDFTATGMLGVNETFVRPDVLRNAIVWGGENIGIGSARKMGWGRFTLSEWSQQ